MPSLVLTPTQAAFVRSDIPDFNFGPTNYLDCGIWVSGSFNRALVEFDMSSLDPTAIVDSASLSFVTYWVIETGPYTNLNYDIYLSGTGWDSSVSWNSQPTLFGSALASIYIAGGGVVQSCDVTSSVVGELPYGNLISFTGLSNGEDGSATNGTICYWGNESSGNNGDTRATLTINYHLPTPPATGIDNIWMGLM